MPPKKEDNSCGKCSKAVKEGIQCEICDCWWHPACAGIESEICESLGKNQQLHWYCLKCNSSVGKLLKEVMKMQDRVDIVEDCVRKMDEKMVAFKNDINKRFDSALAEVHQNISETIKEYEVKHLIDDEIKRFEDKFGETKPKWSELITKEVDSRLTDITGDLDSVQKSVTETKERIMENQDKLKRMNNIIMYNVAESVSDSAAARNKDDLNFCGSLMEKVLKVGYEDGDVTKIVRLGKYDDQHKRPLLVEFSNAHVKNVVMGNVTNLGSAKDDFKGVTISHDMTAKERKECKLLVDEAKKKQAEETGNFIYRVRGLPGQMKVVRFQKH
jgi:hypothetical protein